MASTVVSATTAIAPAKPAAIAGSGTAADTRDGFAKGALTSCVRAWTHAYKRLAQEECPQEYQCQKAGNRAFLKAMPLLCGHKNICDFIACINYASMTGIVTRDEAAHDSVNARVALAALGLKSKPQATGAKSGGKPAADSLRNAEG